MAQMGFETKFFQVFSLVLLCLLLVHEAAECSTRSRTTGNMAATMEIMYKQVSGRKQVAFKRGFHGFQKRGNDGNFEDWDLRRVPSGPDPLHHNGGGTKKPRTP